MSAQEHLTVEERATNNDTWWHIHRVRQLLGIVIKELIQRAEEHDLSKLDDPEVGALTAAPPLDDINYNSKEYEASKASMEKALAHHYGHNRHHPQFHKNGVDDMSLIDFIEMTCDWKASSERHTTGNIRKSIEINGEKYHIAPQLMRVMENTIKELG